MFAFDTNKIDLKSQKIEYLLRRISVGDNSALGSLYELVKNDIYAYALSKMKNPADAEDVLHDVFVKIYKYAAKYHAQGKPMAWIMTITVNVAHRHRELKSRHVSYNEKVGGLESSYNLLEDNTIRSDFVRCLMKALSEEEREIVVLHAVSGFKHREIADILDIPLSTVLSKYHRSIKKLKTVAKEEWI